MLSGKFTYILAFFFPLSQFNGYHIRQQLFCFNQWYLYVSVRVTIQSKLTCNAFGQRSIDFRVFLRKLGDDIFTLVRFLDQCELWCVSSQEVVQFSDQSLHCGDEFDQTFRYQHCTEVIALCGTVSHHLSNVSNHIIQWHVLLFHFFWNDTYVRLNLQSTFQSDMRSRTSHQLDKVPVFAGRVTVTLNVTDYFRVSLTSRIKTERSFNHLVLQVTVDSLRTTDNLNTAVLRSIVFCQYTSVCVWVITTDNYQCLDAQFLDDFQTFIKLFYLFQFGTSRTDDIETTGIAVFVDNIGSQFHIIMVYQTTGAQNETIQFAVLVQCFDTVEQTGNNIVSAGSLSTRQDDTYVDGRHIDSFAFNELNQRHAVSVREQGFDSFLVSNWLCRFTFLYFYSAFQRFRKFGLISSSGNL